MARGLIRRIQTGTFRCLSNSVNLHSNVRSVFYLLQETNLIWLMHLFNIHYSRVDNCTETKQYLFLIKFLWHRFHTKVRRST